jgi:hypothetical protein
MMRSQTVDTIRQRLRSGEEPTLDDMEKLLMIIEELEVECQRERALARQAQIDRDAYDALIDEHIALITAHHDIVQELEAERERERKLVFQAQIDRKTYHALIAAHNALVAVHNDLTVVYERVGLHITNCSNGTAFSWGYQWDGEEWHGGYPTPAAAVEAALRAQLTPRSARGMQQHPNAPRGVQRFDAGQTFPEKVS